jgi:hypothetical protein
VANSNCYAATVGRSGDGTSVRVKCRTSNGTITDSTFTISFLTNL